jgi:hypothetical protein
VWCDVVCGQEMMVHQLLAKVVAGAHTSESDVVDHVPYAVLSN